MEVDEPRVLINPVISGTSSDTIELWDDCMSFPDLLVKVRRHGSCRVAYRDERWREQTIRAEGALSELLQHEIDHLNGILATMRAVDGSAFALRSEWSARRA
jgi:peptide deformylase